jgi:hypothetical protein
MAGAPISSNRQPRRRRRRVPQRLIVAHRGAKILRVRYADNETNYCASCQTGGRLLADRGLSRRLGADWPRTLDEWEDLRRH